MDAAVATAGARVVSAHLTLHTRRAREFIDITDQIRQTVSDASLRHGLAVIMSAHTTACIVVNEHEPELLKDLDRLLSEIAPAERPYAHNGVPCGKGEQPNGHAHCQALLLSSSASLPIVDGRLVLGRFQRIFLLELDCARRREVTVALLGVM